MTRNHENVNKVTLSMYEAFLSVHGSSEKRVRNMKTKTSTQDYSEEQHVSQGCLMKGDEKQTATVVRGSFSVPFIRSYFRERKNGLKLENRSTVEQFLYPLPACLSFFFYLILFKPFTVLCTVCSYKLIHEVSLFYAVTALVGSYLFYRSCVCVRACALCL